MKRFPCLRYATSLHHACAPSLRRTLPRLGMKARVNGTQGTRFNTTLSQAIPQKQASFGVNASGLGATLVAFVLGLGTASGLFANPASRDEVGNVQGPRYADEATTLKVSHCFRWLNPLLEQWFVGTNTTSGYRRDPGSDWG